MACLTRLCWWWWSGGGGSRQSRPLLRFPPTPRAAASHAARTARQSRSNGAAGANRRLGWLDCRAEGGGQSETVDGRFKAPVRVCARAAVRVPDAPRLCRSSGRPPAPPRRCWPANPIRGCGQHAARTHAAARPPRRPAAAAVAARRLGVAAWLPKSGVGRCP
eukprot:349687-Chlamydomonas_euryale.AAC.12